MEDDSDQQSLVVSNDDLLTEILIRLPVTSILRFKSVSKHWRSLLTHTHFTCRYDNLLKTPGLFSSSLYVPFDVENPSTPPFRSLEFYLNRSGAKIVQSCNGLLLCSTDRGYPYRKRHIKYYVFNPTTKQLAIIPTVPGGKKARVTIRFMALAYHQTDCVHYKVVCIRALESPKGSFQIQVYSSETRKWKISIESFYVDKPIFCNPVYWNGAVHWYPIYLDYMYFNIDAEQLETLTLPERLKSFELLWFGESRGHLHLVYEKVLDDLSLHLELYEMLSDHSGWFVKYQLELDELLVAFPEIIFLGCHLFVVMDVVRGEKEEDTFMVLNTFENIITYNVHDKSFNQIFTSSSIRDILGFHRYTETLSSF